jgi:hypothetical protein
MTNNISNVNNLQRTTSGVNALPKAPKNLVAKQMTLLSAIGQLAKAAEVFDNQEVLLFTKDGEKIVPVASDDVQSSILTDAVSSELRASALEAIDNKVVQLEALGISISADALNEITNSSSN